MAEAGFETRLCDALMGIFGRGTHDLKAIVQALGETDLAPPGGERWTEALLLDTLRQHTELPEKIVSATTLHAEPGPFAAVSGSNRTRSADDLVRHGLRNRWYLIAMSSEVTARPLGLTRLGEKLVLWRDAAGKVQALQDQCPHRGVALSVGSVQDGLLACAYHGIQVDGSGAVIRVPALANCPLEGQVLVRRYPVIEQYQGIWAWFGDEAHLDPAPLELPDELATDEWSGWLHMDTWPGHYQYVWDNLCDPMHGPYLHSQTFTLGYGPRDDQVRVQKNEHGFEVFRAGQRGVNFDWMEFVDAGTSYYARVEIPLPPNAGPGGTMQIIFYVTPIDEGQTRIGAWRLRQVAGWQRDLWHFLFKYRIRNFTNAVLAQDKAALAAMPPWPAPENLYQHDIGVARVRRHFREAAEAQAGESLAAE